MIRHSPDGKYPLSMSLYSLLSYLQSKHSGKITINQYHKHKMQLEILNIYSINNQAKLLSYFCPLSSETKSFYLT